MSATTASMPALGYDADAQQIQAHEFAYRRSPDQDAQARGDPPARHLVVIVGAGPVGLSLAIDLAQRGQRVLLLDNDNRLSTGSRAICFAKRTLEIWDRLGVGDVMCAKGVGWNVGRVFLGDELLYRFDLLPEAGHEPAGPPQGRIPEGAARRFPDEPAGPPQGRIPEGAARRFHDERPAFINLQQYYAEAYLAVRAAELPNLEIRWKNEVVALEETGDGVCLGIQTPQGRYQIVADYVAACDGSRSPLRALLGQESKGRVFRDRFLIADVKMAIELPTERWFWFDPPFHRNQSVLLHRQPDGVWRIDFQLGWDADPDEERKPERIQPRIDAMLAAVATSVSAKGFGSPVPAIAYQLQWASVYTFACLRMQSFRHGRVFFAGDAAHGVSPFGARGANAGVQDAENLAWKLDRVLRGEAGDELLDSYASEREFAANENILNSTRATDFITPKSAVSRLFRDATLKLASEHAFARKLVNSGRLSVPATLHGSPLNTPDADEFAGAMVPGAAAADAPLLDTAAAVAPLHGPAAAVAPLGGARWLLRELSGERFALLVAGPPPAWATDLGLQLVELPCAGLVAQRYDLKPGTAYLLRPDQHVCARWRVPTAARVRAALVRACARAAREPAAAAPSA